MGKTRAIAIGINQYQNFQPLSCAQQDAQAFCDFWIYQAGLPSNQCLLFSEVSQPVQGESTYPDRRNLEYWINQISTAGNPLFPLDPDDHLWVFFSGYGSSIDGQDYLMPIDGHPHQIPSTGLSIEWLFSRLRALPTSNLVVILEMNRAASLQIGGLLGNQTAHLAREWEVPVLLSCQPGQFSQETLELRQGLFTAALLEGLRSGQCSTLGSLDAYVQRRLMELSDQHNRPNQQALMVVSPPSQMHRVILPVEESLEPEEVSSEGVPQPTPVLQTTSTEISKPMEPDKKPQSPDPKSNANEEDAQFWRLLILAWGGIALILIGGVFLRNRTAFTAVEGEPTPAVTETVNGSPSPSPQISPSEVVVIPTPAPSPETASPEPVASAPPVQEVPTAPMTAEVVESPAPPSQPAGGSPPTLATVTAVLGSQQASLYLKAIEKARQISASDPSYAEAQTKIEQWSQAIMDIAMGRAAQGQFEGAVAAAGLIPKEVSSYANAQNLMATWKQSAVQAKANEKVIQQAKGMVKGNQASSYNQAIAKLKTIPPGQPGSEVAQKLANQWSQEILKIAYRRLPSNGPAAAIAVAQLVPQNTAAYTEAQKAIAVWRTRL